MRSAIAVAVLTLIAGCGTPRVMQEKKYPPTRAEFEHIIEHVRQRSQERES